MMAGIDGVLSNQETTISTMEWQPEVWDVDSWLSLPSNEAVSNINPSPVDSTTIQKIVRADETEANGSVPAAVPGLEDFSSEKRRASDPEHVESARPQTDLAIGEHLGEAIWKTTLGFLQHATSFLSAPQGTPALPRSRPFGVFPPESDQPCTIPESFLAAISTLAPYVTSNEVSPNCKRHRKIKLQTTKSKEVCTSSALPSFSGQMGKKGRKPSRVACFICSTILPYKRNLIHHLRSEHGIKRSQSLMYKRLNQGQDEIKRRYCAPKRIFKITVSK